MKYVLFFLFAALFLFACGKGSHSGDTPNPTPTTGLNKVYLRLFRADTAIAEINIIENGVRKVDFYFSDTALTKIDVLDKETGQTLQFTAPAAIDFNASDHYGDFKEQRAAIVRATAANGIATDYPIGSVTWEIEGYVSTTPTSLTANANKACRSSRNLVFTKG